MSNFDKMTGTVPYTVGRAVSCKKVDFSLPCNITTLFFTCDNFLKPSRSTAGLQKHLRNEWQFSWWIITFFFIILGACPSGYTLKPGDIPGWGSISGSHSTTTINDCSALCDKDASCRSFEYSKTEMICNLNREHEPTQGPFRDYLFCTCTSCPTGKNVATHHTLFADSFSQWHIYI